MASVLDFVTLDGSAILSALPSVGSLSDTLLGGSFTGTGVISLDGSVMDLLACETDACDRGFLFGSLTTGTEFDASFASVEEFAPDRWSLAEAVTVPAPPTLVLLALGWLAFSAARGKTTG